MNAAKPPHWAEALLRVLLNPRDGETVSGDLLEEYREAIRPARGASGADAWYVRQVAGFWWRSARIWALLLGAATLARTALDWLIPTHDFVLRSTVSTYVSIGILVTAGVWAAWRSRSIAAGALAGFATAVGAGAIQLVGNTVLLAIWHDAETLRAIRDSGGLAEAYSMPLFVVMAGTIVAAAGGLVGRLARASVR